MREFVTANAQTFEYVKLACIAVAVVFGGKALGDLRVPTLPRNVYLWLVAGIPGLIYFAVLSYLVDTSSGHLYSRIASQIAHLPLDSTLFGIGVAAVFVPWFIYDAVYEDASQEDASEERATLFGIGVAAVFYPRAVYNAISEDASQERAKGTRATASIASGPPGGTGHAEKGKESLLHKWVTVVLSYPTLLVLLVAAILANQFVFIILGWFGGHPLPLSAVAAITAATSVGAGLALWLVSRQIQRWLIRVAASSPAAFRRPPARMLVGLVVAGVFFLTLLLEGAVSTLGTLGMLVYIARAVGWSAAIFFGALAAGLALVYGIFAIARHLPTKALVAIFAAPGALASVLEYVLANPNILPG
jgi:hypothetical protein